MNLKKYIYGAVVLATAPFINTAQASAHTDPLAVDTPMVHDPVMAFEDGQYYLYCTGHGITQMTSSDRRHWTIKPEGLLPEGKIPAWTRDEIIGLDINNLTPVEALNKLNEIKKIVTGRS